VRGAGDAEIRTPSLRVVFVLSRVSLNVVARGPPFGFGKVTTDPHILADVSTECSYDKVHNRTGH
jgi:hypothetical protein